MIYAILIFVSAALGALTVFMARPFFNKDARSQRELNKYLKRPLSPEEIGRFYERYIGYLYEQKGYDVEYHGAINGYGDLGCDLIVWGEDEVFIVQTKCWAKRKLIPIKHVFQLYGTLVFFKRTSRQRWRSIKAVFYTTSDYSDLAKKAAKVLGIELRTEKIDRSYPMIKCKVRRNGEKLYFLPFDPGYDKLRINPYQGEFFARTVKEAVEKGFRRVPKRKSA